MLAALLPEGWQTAALTSGALLRSRKVADPGTLLRVLLLHIAGGLSLRQTSVRARAQGLAELSDVALLKRPEDVHELAQLQQRLIANAIGMLKTGGLLVYCTCSLEPAEGPEQVARILGEHRHIALDPFTPDELGGRGEWLGDDGTLRTLPHYLQLSDPELSGMDGFYAARLIKRP